MAESTLATATAALAAEMVRTNGFPDLAAANETLTRALAAYAPVDPVRPLVTLGYVHTNDMTVSFHESLMALANYDAAGPGLLAHDAGRMAMRCGTNGLVEARNQLVAEFLASESQWLMWIDSDMGFSPDTISQLLAVADPTERPIVGALCFASREVGSDGMGGYSTYARPTIFDWTDLGDGFKRFAGRTVYPPASVVRCAATGSACVLIHRSVFETIGADGWYDQLRGTDGMLLGEDISFCARAGAAGFPVFVHTGVRTTHRKPQWVAEPDFWQRYLPPPATDEVAVIVPVLNRWKNAAPFMASLRASTGLARVYAVAESSDDAVVRAWADAGATVLTGDAHTFAEKVNAGYRQTTEPWLFLAGDDVRFYPGWLDHAQHMAATFGADVVGTNDLGNPRVLAGEHATHLLVRRSYVDTVGASWDGPGVVCHEGYSHWYVDNELVSVAKQRRAWVMALGSVVEHLHPAWGKGTDDEVYELGQSHMDADRDLFAARLAEFAS